MSQESEFKQKITQAIQNIQDNVDEGTKGLARPDVKNDMVFWELGVLLKEFSATLLFGFSCFQWRREIAYSRFLLVPAYQ